jgi:3-polyprenyl-4-hydroxybenzoate decarboxylase
MMQVANLETSIVKNVVKTQAAAKLASEQKADKAKPAEVVELLNQPPKPQSFSRTLEAYSDCV